MVGHSIHYDALGKTAGYEGYRHFSTDLFGGTGNHKHFVGLGHLGYTTVGTGTVYLFSGANSTIGQINLYQPAFASYQNAYDNSIFALDIVIINMTVCNAEPTQVDGRFTCAVRGQYNTPSNLNTVTSATESDMTESYWIPAGTSLTIFSKSNPLYIPWLGNGNTSGYHYLTVRSNDGPRMDITCTYAMIHNTYDTDWTGSGYGA